MNAKNILTGLACIIATTTAAQKPETVHAKGSVVVAPTAYDMKSLAHVQIYLDKDTINLYAGPTGLAQFDIPLNTSSDTTTYTAFVQPGRMDGKENGITGDDFKPYFSTIQLTEGYNNMQTLSKDAYHSDDMRLFTEK